jgi:hypothetical protein
MKIHIVGAEVYANIRTDGRTDRWSDMTKLTVALRHFAKTLQTCHILNVET